jgi:hypothetical protein
MSTFGATIYDAFETTFLSTIFYTIKSAIDSTHCLSHRSIIVSAHPAAMDASIYSTLNEAISRTFSAT